MRYKIAQIHLTDVRRGIYSMQSGLKAIRFNKELQSCFQICNRLFFSFAFSICGNIWNMSGESSQFLIGNELDGDGRQRSHKILMISRYSLLFNSQTRRD